MAKTTLNYTPTKNLVLILPNEIESKTAGGIIIPDTVKDGIKPTEGTVVAIGEDVINIKPGMTVIYGKASGFDVPVDNVVYRMMEEIQILLIKTA